MEYLIAIAFFVGMFISVCIVRFFDRDNWYLDEPFVFIALWPIFFPIWIFSKIIQIFLHIAECLIE